MQDTVKLDRALGLWSVVLFGLAYMTPMIVFGTFGALAAASQGTRQLTREDPAPQTIYRVSSTDNTAILVNVRLRYTK